MRSKRELVGRTDVAIGGKEKQGVQDQNGAATIVELARRVVRRAGVSSVVRPKASQWWAY